MYYQTLYKDATNTITAYEKFSDYSRAELLVTKKLLEANAKVQELSRQELIEKETLLKAAAIVGAKTPITKVIYIVLKIIRRLIYF